jgi:hypothetical protein
VTIDGTMPYKNEEQISENVKSILDEREEIIKI